MNTQPTDVKRFRPLFVDVLATCFKVWVANLLLGLLFGALGLILFLLMSFGGLVLVAT